MLKNLLKKPNNKYILQGKISHPKYQPLADAFENLFKEGYDNNSQLSIYVEGEQVVDFFGHTPDIFSNEN